jgi:tetratricopeptide (TPR) repeat protein
MRALKMAMLMLGLVFCSVQTLAQPEQPPPQPPSRQPPPPQLAMHSSPRYSADGLYNLANSYARAGKPGLAVLTYERALLMAPGDADIIANRDYVRTTAQLPTESPGRFAQIITAVSPRTAAWLGVLGIALAGGGLLVRKLTSRSGRVWRSSVLVGIALTAITVSNAILLWPRMHEAVILANQTPARVTPVPMGDTAFVLREADTVTITAQHEEFILIRTRSGLSGWVARANLGAVVP